ncbi:hypothetical protein CE91St51_18290 [[Clostridium] innocuum]|jgi:hypothetical protein|nr:hypothetical protein CE91St51_18290 [[Clostridium] innocuum]
MYGSEPADQRYGSFLHIIEKATEEDYVQSSFCRYHWTSEFSETGL